MRLLLDSHVVLWALAWPERLREITRSALASPENEISVSSATLWELELKRAKGKLELPQNFAAVLREQDFGELPVLWRHTQAIHELPPIHADPFDRLLLAQTKEEGLTFVTGDGWCLQYPIALMPA